jgi:hypothetical protein
MPKRGIAVAVTVIVACLGPSDRVRLGAGRGWKGDTDSPPAGSPTSVTVGSPGYRTHSDTKDHIIPRFPDEEAEPAYQKPTAFGLSGLATGLIDRVVSPATQDDPG